MTLKCWTGCPKRWCISLPLKVFKTLLDKSLVGLGQVMLVSFLQWSGAVRGAEIFVNSSSTLLWILPATKKAVHCKQVLFYRYRNKDIWISGANRSCRLFSIWDKKTKQVYQCVANLSTISPTVLSPTVAISQYTSGRKNGISMFDTLLASNYFQLGLLHELDMVSGHECLYDHYKLQESPSNCK